MPAFKDNNKNGRKKVQLEVLVLEHHDDDHVGVLLTRCLMPGASLRLLQFSSAHSFIGLTEASVRKMVEGEGHPLGLDIAMDYGGAQTDECLPFSYY